MRECASQQGISPLILDYVSNDVRNDSKFIENLVNNCSDFNRLTEIAEYYNINLNSEETYSVVCDNDQRK